MGAGGRGRGSSSAVPIDSARADAFHRSRDRKVRWTAARGVLVLSPRRARPKHLDRRLRMTTSFPASPLLPCVRPSIQRTTTRRVRLASAPSDSTGLTRKRARVLLRFLERHDKSSDYCTRYSIPERYVLTRVVTMVVRTLLPTFEGVRVVSPARLCVSGPTDPLRKGTNRHVRLLASTTSCCSRNTRLKNVGAVLLLRSPHLGWETSANWATSPCTCALLPCRRPQGLSDRLLSRRWGRPRRPTLVVVPRHRDHVRVRHIGGTHTAVPRLTRVAYLTSEVGWSPRGVPEKHCEVSHRDYPITVRTRIARSCVRAPRLICDPTLRQTNPRAEPEGAMCVQRISAQCVLQFTPSIAAGCVLHRPENRVIHRLESCNDHISMWYVAHMQQSGTDSSRKPETLCYFDAARSAPEEEPWCKTPQQHQ